MKVKIKGFRKTILHTDEVTVIRIPADAARLFCPDCRQNIAGLERGEHKNVAQIESEITSRYDSRILEGKNK